MYRYDNHTDLTFPSGLHNHCEIIIVSSGKLTVIVNSQPVQIEQGNGLYLPGYVIHSFKTNEHSECHIWEYDSAFIQEKISNRIITFKFPIKALELFGKSRNSSDCYIKKSEIYFIMSCIGSGTSEIYDLKNDDIVGKTCYYIAENYRDNITLTDAAGYAGVSPSYLSRTFKSSVGLSFNSCLTATRIDNAMNMLKYSTTSVTEIAMHCGFGTLRNFNRFFKRIMGCTPTEYRKDIKR